MAPYDLLLSEGSIGPMRLKNRILHAPMARGMSNRDGTITQTHVDFLEARARGGAALVSTEGSYVDVRGNSHAPALGVHSDAMIPGLRRAADAVHAHGAKFALELFYAGRVGRQFVPFVQPLGPSAVPCYANVPTSYPREMTIDDIEDLLGRFAAAARRAVDAGADMLWIHGGHGYALSAFLSPLTNQREDRYGGDLAGRARFPLEIVRTVRAAVASDVPIAYRTNGEDYVDGGLRIEEAVAFAELLVDEGVDLIDVTGGLYESKRFTMQGADMPQGGFVDNALQFKAGLGDSVLVSVVQKMNNPTFANEILGRGIDFVTMARGFHADPEFVRKIEEGRPEDVIPCIACLRCLDLHGTPGSTVQCSTNPATGFERRRRVQSAPVSRGITVVGGGVAGMEAAVSLTRQGHRVSLFERSGTLGGQVRWAVRTLPDYQKFVDYLTTQVTKLGIDVRLNHTVTAAEILSDNPDVVVVATGSKAGPDFWSIEGNPGVFRLAEAYARPDDEWESRVAVIGGDMRSASVALHLAALGREVHIIEPKPDFANDTHRATQGRITDQLVNHPNIVTHRESTVEEFSGPTLTLQSRNEFSVLDGVGSVVLGEVVANNDLYESLIATDPGFDLYVIGDATFPRDMHAATQAAAEVAEWIRLSSFVHRDGEPAFASSAKEND